MTKRKVFPKSIIFSPNRIMMPDKINNMAHETNNKSAIAYSKDNLPLMTAVDLFCGAGGLTRGLLDANISVSAGYDIDPACKFSYEFNNRGASFNLKSVAEISIEELASHYPHGHIRVLVGCAPCQPFSKYTQGNHQQNDSKWNLLHEFIRLVRHLKPEIISMENVVEIKRHSVFKSFVTTLKETGYHVSDMEAFCPDFGVPQQRKRLVLLASLIGPINLKKTEQLETNITVRQTIAHLPPLRAGDKDPNDVLHCASRLSPINLQRIKVSRPGGYWRDWPIELVAQCHREKTGQTYPSVYGRMQWDQPAPTITTQFFGFGNGRFGHPEQDRAISLREGALLQSFPENYKFIDDNQPVIFATLGRMIGNAVPVKLGTAIGQSIIQHLKTHFA